MLVRKLSLLTLVLLSLSVHDSFQKLRLGWKKEVDKVK